MRRSILAVAAVALLTIVVAAPATAVPPNEVLIAKSLQRTGLIPGWANGRIAAAAVKALGATAPTCERRSPLVQRTLSGGQTRQTRFLGERADDAGATPTYTSTALVLLVEFGDDPWPAGAPAPTGPMTPGPRHGSIPAPASDDNSTFWPGDFEPRHYQLELLGDSFPLYDAASLYRGSDDTTMRTWLLEQSHGSYAVTGEVGNWVKLDLPESWYGADSSPWESTDDLTGPVWRLARDAVARFAAEHPDFPWAEYDRENQYGVIGEDFSRPDGIVDHLILVHAGSDQSAGGGAQGPDAIWARSDGIYERAGGSPGDLPGYMVPGTEGQGPEQKGIWVFPFTVDPEDGDPGVFCHEFAHDLGLPDQYDYSSDPGDGSGFWTTMATGSWLGRRWGLGSAPGPLNAWDKAALGFVTPREVKRGTTATVKLQAAATGAPGSTAVVIPLPRRRHVVELSGKDGDAEWYSGTGHGLDRRLTTSGPLTVPSADATLAFRTWYDIEAGHDYGFVFVSDDGGATWTTAKSPGVTVEVQDGVFGLTGGDTGTWGTISYDLGPWAGEAVLVQFRYATDSGVAGRGWEVTGVAVGGVPVSDGAFTADGWMRADGRTTAFSENYYIAEYRTRAGADASLADCYELDREHGTSRVDWYAYDPGLHLIYRDTFWDDNDVGDHPGEGGWLVVDARPDPDVVLHDDAAGFWRTRIQLRDATFSSARTSSQTIYFRDYETEDDVGERVAPGKAAAPWFNDAWPYWFEEMPLAGVKLPAGQGVRIKVKSTTASAMTIWVDNKK